MDHSEKLNARSETDFSFNCRSSLLLCLYVFIEYFLECLLISYLTQSHTERGPDGSTLPSYIQVGII